jgi:hypothetical protein
MVDEREHFWMIASAALTRQSFLFRPEGLRHANYAPTCQGTQHVPETPNTTIKYPFPCTDRSLRKHHSLDKRRNIQTRIPMARPSVNFFIFDNTVPPAVLSKMTNPCHILLGRQMLVSRSCHACLQHLTGHICSVYVHYSSVYVH